MNPSNWISKDRLAPEPLQLPLLPFMAKRVGDGPRRTPRAERIIQEELGSCPNAFLSKLPQASSKLPEKSPGTKRGTECSPPRHWFLVLQANR